MAALAEELAFALTADLMAEQYRQPSPALDRLAAAKAFLKRQRHPVGPTVLEVVEIATAQGELPGQCQQPSTAAACYSGTSATA